MDVDGRYLVLDDALRATAITGPIRMIFPAKHCAPSGPDGSDRLSGPTGRDRHMDGINEHVRGRFSVVGA